MPLPAGLLKIQIRGDLRAMNAGATSKGRIQFFATAPLYAPSQNVILTPTQPITATITGGTFLTEEFISPGDPAVSPQNMPLLVVVRTPAYNDSWYVQIPAGASGEINLADLPRSSTAPAMVTYALAAQLAEFLRLTGGTMTGPITWAGTPSASGHLTPKGYVDAAVAAVGGTATLLTGPLFNPEDYGDPVGDGVADDYGPVKAAWDAMINYPLGVGKLFIPFGKNYRVDLSNTARVPVSADKARAALALPQVSRTAPKRSYGIVSAGEAYVVRTAELAGTPTQVNTAGVLYFDCGSTVYTWSPTTGLPCAIGGPDADMTDPTGNSFSNIHFSIENVIIRSNNNPSLCAVNLEQISTCRIDRARFDVASVLDLIPEPTHPTGAALLLPRTNNNVAISLDRLLAEGYYAGVPLTEHVELKTAIALRCKIGVFTRRQCSHYGKVMHLKIEQCPNGISGWDPSGSAPNGGIVPIHGWTGHLDFLDLEDYAYNGATPWIYAPTAGVHINDPNGAFNGQIGFLGRINSEPAPPTGIGIGAAGGSSSLYVRGPSGTTASPIAIYGFHHGQAATRILPPGDVPPVEYRLFAAENGPSISATDGHQPINLGVQVNVTANALATKLWFYRGTTAIAGAITGRLWRRTGVGTGVALGDLTFVVSGTGWISAEFVDPIALTPGETYVATVHFPDEWPFTASYWDSGPGAGGIIAGPLRAFSTNDQPGGQGVFSSGAITTYPATTGNGGNYWVDISVTPV